MRAGPGLGNIGPEQSDYNQAVKGGGHGNYRNIVVAPESVQEMCDFTQWAFELAFRYRNPAIVLADAVLGQMMETLRLPPMQVPHDDVTAWAVQATAETRANVITSIILDPDELEAHNLKLQAKYGALTREAAAETHATEDAQTVLVAYGICSRLARTAVERCRRAGKAVGLFRPKTLQPFPRVELARLAARCRELLVVELSNGQLLDDVRLTCGDRVPIRSLTRMGGNLVTVDAIIREIG
jgi:2-oxoisovalerate ferredoxin oxidoreductase alpha subunit